MKITTHYDRKGVAERVNSVKGDLTVQQLGSASGVPKSVVGRVMLGGSTRQSRLQAIAAALNVNFEWLVHGTGSVRAPARIDHNTNDYRVTICQRVGQNIWSMRACGLPQENCNIGLARLLEAEFNVRIPHGEEAEWSSFADVQGTIEALLNPRSGECKEG